MKALIGGAPFIPWVSVGEECFFEMGELLIRIESTVQED
jgi:hypothetical protein